MIGTHTFSGCNHSNTALDEMDPKFEKDVEEAIKAAGLPIAREELLAEEIFDLMKTEAERMAPSALL